MTYSYIKSLGRHSLLDGTCEGAAINCLSSSRVFAYAPVCWHSVLLPPVHPDASSSTSTHSAVKTQDEATGLSLFASLCAALMRILKWTQAKAKACKTNVSRWLGQRLRKLLFMWGMCALEKINKVKT